MQPRLLVSIIIVTWNSKKYLTTCLNHLLAQSFRDFEVILVDNGSDDGALDGVQERYSSLNLRVHGLSANTGFATANNIGASLACGQWLALLNADAFPVPNWLESLVKAADSHPKTFFASRQIQADTPSYLDGEGDVYHVSSLAWRKNYGQPVYPAHKMENVFSACGAAAFFPRQEFLDAGGFDEDYFSYHEDVDLGFRLRLRGLNCMLVPEAVVHHVGSASTGKRSDFSVYFGHRNLVWTYFKDMPSLLFWLYLPLHLITNVFFLIYFTFRGQGNTIWRAKWDALRGLTAILKKRPAIQSQRKVSVAEIHRAMSRNWFTPFISFLKRKSE